MVPFDWLLMPNEDKPRALVGCKVHHPYSDRKLSQLLASC